MSGKVVDIEANLPHFVIPTNDGVVHVIPEVCFRNIVNGSMRLEELEGWRPVITKIIDEWLEQA